MDVFGLRNRLIEDYSTYATSFVHIQDKRIRERVDEDLGSGLLWPEPLIQLNPAFEPGGYVGELVEQGILHPECGDIFRRKQHKDDAGQELRLHKHQADAINAARTGASYVLTTGTGSGKSLAYIVPIVDWVLRRGAGKGIQAIVVYPMNALANSQFGELEKFLGWGYPEGAESVRFARYTGQETEEERDAILLNPPDILLTNYVMLELILTRPRDTKLVERARGLRFLVLDELHTYRGRQGADVAFLARRVREACQAPDLQFVGTSATLAGPGTYEQQQAEVARVASQLFGAEVTPENVIGETLRRATDEPDLDDTTFVDELKQRVKVDAPWTQYLLEEFVVHPLSRWIESTFGVVNVEGRLRRRPARPITGPYGAAAELANLTGLSKEEAADRIRAQLLAGYEIESPATGFKTFAFKVHQFISRGETAYASLESEDDRYITTNAQVYVPDRPGDLLLPLAFCRECGQDYYSVLRHDRGDSPGRLSARSFGAIVEDDERATAGYVYVSQARPWPAEAEEIMRRLPDDWVEPNGTVKRHYRNLLPALHRLDPDGRESEDGVDVHFVPAPFRFCLSCGVAYGGQVRSDFTKLTTLGSGGRSTATTILSLALVRGLRKEMSLDEKARKLLSFTDNRQDASLQAGHFNDFIQISLIRSALYQAASKAGPEGLAYDELAQRVFEALNLPKELYASNPEAKYAAAEETERALRGVIAYRIFRDLERGWRVTSPNLEQVGLLKVKYRSLDEVCANQDEWRDKHDALASALPETRHHVATVLLDFIRRALCIKVDYLKSDWQERLATQSSVHLREPWAIEEEEKLRTAGFLVPRSRRQGDFEGDIYLSPRGGFGQFLRRKTTFPGYDAKLDVEQTQRISLDLLGVLGIAGLVEVVRQAAGSNDVLAYQLPASAFLWLAGDGSEGYHDRVRVPRVAEGGTRANPFFVSFYKSIAEDAKGLEAREHTAQVPSEVRQEREAAFRSATLPILFCSPTMELGVDIADLNAVNMRNVPPTPANYAQRSGRAGRSGQPALVFTYCATGSPHDQWFFRRPEIMVSGQVSPPRLDLANEDLVKAHVHAVWLAETGISLGASLKDVLDLTSDTPTLTLLPEKREQLGRDHPRERARERSARILASIGPQLAEADWHTADWLDRSLKQAVKSFDAACDRWRGLYRAALAQRDAQHKVIGDASRSQSDKNQAKRLRGEAESQLNLLTAEDSRLVQSDFYSYRYFASEGFLPGYSFPRLPLSAYIPGRRKGSEEFLSRPRFLAIAEFGPRSFVYHEGSRYIINRVILPISEDATEEPALTQTAKQCPNCGYLHPVLGNAGADVCERCHQQLDGTIDNLFRLQNVTTKRRDRINSDEEERMRQGFEIRTGLRFVEHGGVPSRRVATVATGDTELATMTYGQSATLWRINLGWRRTFRRDGRTGFELDVERGYWAKSDAPGDDADDPMSPKKRTVVPFVEDHKNALLFEPTGGLDVKQMASLQSALKQAIQVEFQLEDSELAAEPLPDDKTRRLILLYEAAEGGAGVLHRLLDPGALASVARRALEICHYDPDSLTDQGSAPGARERCEAACYDCLMSYRNQRDHQQLDRHSIVELLSALAHSTVSASAGAKSRSQQVGDLIAVADSELEEQWIRAVDDGGYRLPNRGQTLVEECHARPDFYYAEQLVAVFIDGPHHEHDHTRQLDAQKRDCLEDAGYQVVRFGPDPAEWPEVFAKHPDLFGSPR